MSAYGIFVKCLSKFAHLKFTVSGRSKHASKQASNSHAHTLHNEVVLVWGSLRLALIIQSKTSRFLSKYLNLESNTDQVEPLDTCCFYSSEIRISVLHLSGSDKEQKKIFEEGQRN